MEDMTIKSCKNNVHTYLTKLQETRNDIDPLQKYGIKYDEQHFITLTFDELVNTAGYFLADVNCQQSEWVKNP